MIGWLIVAGAAGVAGLSWAARRRRRAARVSPGIRAHTRPPPSIERIEVATGCGPVAGFRATTDGPITFRGMPFAAPLRGADAFRPPRPVEPWGPTPRDASRYGPAVAQDRKACTFAITGAPTDPLSTYGPPGDDGLNLNLTTPALGPDRRAPVLVWIHGGANKCGSNAESGLFLPGSGFTRRGVVCVSLNYRVGLPGFLHLPGQGSTNRALRDLVAGLGWVRDEIAAFGGDPANVTVFGESAGAVNIAALLASPLARGLFHKAILSSGGPGDLSPAAAAVVLADAGDALRRKCPEVRYRPDGEPIIETLDAEGATRAAAVMKDSLLDRHGVSHSPAMFASVSGDDALPRPIIEAITAGGAAGIPLLCGYNADEFVGFLRGLLAGMGLARRVREPSAARRDPASQAALLGVAMLDGPRGTPPLAHPPRSRLRRGLASLATMPHALSGLGPALAAPLIRLVLERMPGALGPAVMLRHVAGLTRAAPGGDDATVAAAVEALQAALAALDSPAPPPRSAWRQRWAIDEGDPLPALVQLLATAPQDGLADAQAAHADVYSYTLRLDPAQSPLGGNMHGIDLALVFRPDEEYTAAERRYVARAFFGRDDYGAALDAVVEGMRDAIVRFMQTGSPGWLAGADGARVAWATHGTGRMTIAAAPSWSPQPAGRSAARAALDRIIAAHLPR